MKTAKKNLPRRFTKEEIICTVYFIKLIFFTNR